MNTMTWNRPAHKAAGNKLQYTALQIAARVKFAEALSKLLSANAGEIGCFETPNEAKSMLMLALTLTVPSIAYTDSKGNARKTTQFALNINAPVDMGKKPKAAAAPAPDAPVNDDLDSIMEEIRANRTK